MPPDSPDSPDPPGRLRPLIEACVAFGHDSAPWVAFRDEFHDLIRQVAGARRAPDDFPDWFLGWLYKERKLDRLFDRLNHPDPEEPITDPDRFVCEYLKKTVASGVGARRREDRERHPAAAAEPAVAPASDLEHEEQRQRVVAAVRRLDPALRLPLWLQHLKHLGDLDPDDLAAVAAAAGSTPAAVRADLDRELLANDHLMYPISTRKIGETLDLPPLANGKYAAVSQRLKRAAAKLAELLAPTGEDDA